jgi:hypothetical protein
MPTTKKTKAASKRTSPALRRKVVVATKRAAAVVKKKVATKRAIIAVKRKASTRLEAATVTKRNATKRVTSNKSRNNVSPAAQGKQKSSALEKKRKGGMLTLGRGGAEARKKMMQRTKAILVKFDKEETRRRRIEAEARAKKGVLSAKDIWSRENIGGVPIASAKAYEKSLFRLHTIHFTGESILGLVRAFTEDRDKFLRETMGIEAGEQYQGAYHNVENSNHIEIRTYLFSSKADLESMKRLVNDLCCYDDHSDQMGREDVTGFWVEGDV